MDIVVENLRGVIVLVASLLGFAAQAAPYVEAASRGGDAADVYVDEEARADVYRAGAVAPLAIAPPRELSRNRPTSNVLHEDELADADARGSARAGRGKPDGAHEVEPEAHTALVRVVASARSVTLSSP